MSDTTFQISTDSQNYPYLQKEGKYGAGQPNGGDVTWQGYELCTEEGGPGYDPDCDRDHYAKFEFFVNHPEYGPINLREWQPLSSNSGSKAIKWLIALGVEYEEVDGNLQFKFDENKNLNVQCVIDVAKPRPDKNDSTKFYNGKVRGVFKVE